MEAPAEGWVGVASASIGALCIAKILRSLQTEEQLMESSNKNRSAKAFSTISGRSKHSWHHFPRSNISWTKGTFRCSMSHLASLNDEETTNR
jgi:hypothetical protein